MSFFRAGGNDPAISLLWCLATARAPAVTIST